MDHRSCPECGARLAPGAERCDLCGAPLEVQDGEASQANEEGAPGREDSPDVLASGGDIPEPSTPVDEESEGLHCTACGATHPPGSNFCSRCGASLERGTRAVPQGRTAPPSPARPPVSLPEGSASSASDVEGQSGLTRHVAMLVGLAVLVVVALYMITVMSKQGAPVNPEAAVGAPAESRAASVIQEHEALPIGEAFRDRVDSLQAVIQQSEAGESVQARGQLVDFLIGIGRIDRAAIEQQRLARITDEAPEWKKAGNLLFDWMEMTDPDSKSQVALLTIDAYKQVLQHQPDDLDARADLGWAYQYDPQNPMESIRQTNLVLEESPDHLTANYNRGVFLMRINRLDDAVRQFERVKVIAGDASPYYRQAEMWIDTIRASRAEREGG